jgi:hypothetical protein
MISALNDLDALLLSFADNSVDKTMLGRDPAGPPAAQDSA